MLSDSLGSSRAENSHLLQRLHFSAFLLHPTLLSKRLGRRTLRCDTTAPLQPGPKPQAPALGGLLSMAGSLCQTDKHLGSQGTPVSLTAPRSHRLFSALFQENSTSGGLCVVLRHFLFCLHRSFRKNCFWKQEGQMKATLGFFSKFKTDHNIALLQEN